MSADTVIEVSEATKNKVESVPGDWHAIGREIWADGRIVARACNSIDDVSDPTHARDTLALCADAHLIAAAPDFLEAATLQEAAENHWANCEDCEGSASPELGCETAFKMADDARLMRRAAIAKATGGAR